MLPGLQNLRSVAERMKTLSNRLFVAANMNGQLRLRIETSAAKVETNYTNLIHPELDGGANDPAIKPIEDKTKFSEVSVDIKDFIKFLHSHHINPSNVVCCVHEQLCLVFYVYVGGNNTLESGDETLGIFTYLISARTS